MAGPGQGDSIRRLPVVGLRAFWTPIVLSPRHARHRARGVGHRRRGAGARGDSRADPRGDGDRALYLHRQLGRAGLRPCHFHDGGCLRRGVADAPPLQQELRPAAAGVPGGAPVSQCCPRRLRRRCSPPSSPSSSASRSSRLSGIAAAIATLAVLGMFKTFYSNWSEWTLGAATMPGIPIYVDMWIALAPGSWWRSSAAYIYQRSKFGLALSAPRGRTSSRARAARHQHPAPAPRRLRAERLLHGYRRRAGGALPRHHRGQEFLAHHHLHFARHADRGRPAQPDRCTEWAWW